MSRWRLNYALALASLASFHTPAAAAAAPPAWMGVWRGTIGTMAVQACFQHDDYSEFGAYYYMRHLGIIHLSPLSAKGQPSAGQPVWTEAGGDNAAKGPLWRITTVTAGHLQGVWSDGAKSLPIDLGPVAMGAATDRADRQEPCGSLAFSQPRYMPPVITTEPAMLKGFAFTHVRAKLGQQFTDSGFETFQLPGTSEAIRRVNTALHAKAPTSRDHADDYFICSMSALGATGYDGNLSIIIRPLLITRDWLVVQETEDDYCGGAHPNQNVSHQTWDLRKGVKVDPDTWFTPAALARTVHRAGTADAYVTTAYTASFIRLLLAAYPRKSKEDEDCREEVRQAFGWEPWLTEKGIAFTPSLSHAMQACTDDAIVPFAQLEPYLNAAGRAGVAAFRRSLSPGKP